MNVKLTYFLVSGTESKNLTKWNKKGKVMNGKFILVKFLEFDFLRWQLQNWKKNQPTFSVKVSDVYLKQNIVFHSLILYITSKFKNQEGKNYERKPEAHYS